eukprot:6135447-Ditylum_brightwellii.AAC.1
MPRTDCERKKDATDDSKRTFIIDEETPIDPAGCHKNTVKQFQWMKDSEKLFENEEEGEIHENSPRHEHVKSPGKVRLLLGLEVVQLLSGEIDGHCCKRNTVCSEKDEGI